MYVNARKKTPLEVHIIFLGKKEIYLVLRHDV
jgi:hypothetical protein